MVTPSSTHAAESDAPKSERAPGRARVLLVEGEASARELLVEALGRVGYDVTPAASGHAAERLVNEIQPDLVVMDLVLPDMDGLLLCSELRAKSLAPIVILTGSKRHRDRILSLRLGADDFIAKPFDLHELIERLAAILRRTFASENPTNGSGGNGGAATSNRSGGSSLGRRAGDHDVYQVGKLQIDRGRKSVTIAGQPVHLTPTEDRLLTTLASDPERVFGRDALARAIWGLETAGDSRAVDVHIRRLRAKLEPFGGSAPSIVTVRGFGYKLL